MTFKNFMLTFIWMFFPKNDDDVIPILPKFNEFIFKR